MSPLRTSLIIFYVITFLALAHAQGIILSEYTKCKTPNNRAGTCISEKECDPLQTIRNAKPNSKQALSFLSQCHSKCGKKKDKILDKIVCCRNDGEEYPNPRDPFSDVIPPTQIPPTQPLPSQPLPTQLPPRQHRKPPQSPPTEPQPKQPLTQHPNYILLPTHECGLDVEDRIVGGNLTSIDEFPWTALLEFEMIDGTKSFSCGGSLISNRYILTAAHCTNKAKLRGLKLVGVRLGEHNTATDPDCEKSAFNGDTRCVDSVQDYKIEKEIVHESYRPGSSHQFHDIALLRLKTSVTFSDSIKPICIPTEEEILDNLYIGRSLTVAGFGSTENGKLSTVKLKVNVPVVDNIACSNLFASLRREVFGNQMCAGGIKGVDSCGGDSGNALMSRDKMSRDKSTRYHVAGIVSYGLRECGAEHWPAVYTRVAWFSRWILNNLEPSEEIWMPRIL